MNDLADGLKKWWDIWGQKRIHLFQNVFHSVVVIYASHLCKIEVITLRLHYIELNFKNYSHWKLKVSTFITVNRNGISAMKTVFSPPGLGGEYVKCPQLSTQGGWGTKLVCVVVEWSFNEPNFLQKTKLLRFIYSEKATKSCKIFTLLLSYVVPVKSKVNILQNFLNFKPF